MDAPPSQLPSEDAACRRYNPLQLTSRHHNNTITWESYTFVKCEKWCTENPTTKIQCQVLGRADGVGHHGMHTKGIKRHLFTLPSYASYDLEKKSFKQWYTVYTCTASSEQESLKRDLTIKKYAWIMADGPFS